MVVHTCGISYPGSHSKTPSLKEITVGKREEAGKEGRRGPHSHSHTGVLSNWNVAMPPTEERRGENIPPYPGRQLWEQSQHLGSENTDQVSALTGIWSWGCRNFCLFYLHTDFNFINNFLWFVVVGFAEGSKELQYKGVSQVLCTELHSQVPLFFTLQPD